MNQFPNNLTMPASQRISKLVGMTRADMVGTVVATDAADKTDAEMDVEEVHARAMSVGSLASPLRMRPFNL